MKFFLLILYILLILISCLWINFGKNFGKIQYYTTCLLKTEWPEENLNSNNFFKYDKKTCLLLLKCCVLSSVLYSNKVNFKNCIFFDKVYTLHSYSFSRKLYKFGFIAKCKNFFVISLKSTSNLDDIYVSSDTNMINIEDGGIHRGYYTQSIEMLQNVYTILSNHKNIKKIFICGHSLGGTLASVLGYLLSKFLKKYKICVYNYASTKFGNIRLKYNIEKMKNLKIFNVLNKSDLVTQKPVCRNFERIGELIEHDIDTGNNNTNHGIRVYKECILKVKKSKIINIKNGFNEKMFRLILDFI